MDIGVYTIYPMVVLFGMPKRVIASGTVLSSGADGQGAVTFEYDGMEATVLYSKIADSSLPTEIQGEDGTLALNRINKIERVTYTPRKTNVAGGKGDNPEPENITMPTIKDEYYYEVAEFIDLVLSGETRVCYQQSRQLTYCNKVSRRNTPPARCVFSGG